MNNPVVIPSLLNIKNHAEWSIRILQQKRRIIIYAVLEISFYFTADGKIVMYQAELIIICVDEEKSGVINYAYTIVKSLLASLSVFQLVKPGCNSMVYYYLATRIRNMINK